MNIEEIDKLKNEKLKTDKELERVEIFVLHYAIPNNTAQCIKSLLIHNDWPYKITILDTSYYQKGVLAKIYNKLIKESTCDYIAFMCSDAEFKTDWLKKSMRHLKENKKAGCIVPLAIPAINPAMDVNFESGEYELSPRAISIAISLFRKQNILDVGGFNERFYLYGHDVNLMEKLSKKYSLILDSSIRIEHQVGSTTNLLFNKKEIEEISNYNKNIK